MTAYEMLLSESQERMLMVLDPAKEREAEAIFRNGGSISLSSVRPRTRSASPSPIGGKSKRIADQGAWRHRATL